MNWLLSCVWFQIWFQITEIVVSLYGIMAYEFGLRWHLAPCISFMLLCCLQQLMNSWISDYAYGYVFFYLLRLKFYFFIILFVRYSWSQKCLQIKVIDISVMAMYINNQNKTFQPSKWPSNSSLDFLDLLLVKNILGPPNRIAILNHWSH